MKNVIGRITISGENAIRSKRFGGRMRSKAPGRVKKTGKVMEMASRLFQSIVLQMKDTVDRTIGIVDASGAVVACTDLPRIGEMREEAITELGFAGEIVRFGGYTYHTTGDRASIRRIRTGRGRAGAQHLLAGCGFNQQYQDAV